MLLKLSLNKGEQKQCWAFSFLSGQRAFPFFTWQFLLSRWCSKSSPFCFWSLKTVLLKQKQNH